MFTQLRQSAFRAALCSVLLIAAFGQSAQAASKFSNTQLIKHSASSGGKGKDTIALKAPRNIGSKCAKFIGAEVVYKKQRFGKVEVLTKPVKGCNPGKNACNITASWKHAPAGDLNYQFRVNWNVSASGC